MALLKSCCICISLRTGSIICGALGIILSVIAGILMIANAIKVKTIVADDISPIAVKVITAINLIITITISILLIIGAVRRKTWFMIPWVVLALIHAIGLFVSVIYTAVDYYVKGDNTVGTVALILGLAIVAIHVYLWLVVYSYYRRLSEQKNGPYERPTI